MGFLIRFRRIMADIQEDEVQMAGGGQVNLVIGMGKTQAGEDIKRNPALKIFDLPQNYQIGVSFTGMPAAQFDPEKRQVVFIAISLGIYEGSMRKSDDSQADRHHKEGSIILVEDGHGDHQKGQDAGRDPVSRKGSFESRGEAGGAWWHDLSGKEGRNFGKVEAVAWKRCRVPSQPIPTSSLLKLFIVLLDGFEEASGDGSLPLAGRKQAFFIAIGDKPDFSQYSGNT